MENELKISSGLIGVGLNYKGVKMHFLTGQGETGYYYRDQEEKKKQEIKKIDLQILRLGWYPSYKGIFAGIGIEYNSVYLKPETGAKKKITTTMPVLSVGYNWGSAAKGLLIGGGVSYANNFGDINVTGLDYQINIGYQW